MQNTSTTTYTGTTVGTKIALAIVGSAILAAAAVGGYNLDKKTYEQENSPREETAIVNQQDVKVKLYPRERGIVDAEIGFIAETEITPASFINIEFAKNINTLKSSTILNKTELEGEDITANDNKIRIFYNKYSKEPILKGEEVRIIVKGIYIPSSIDEKEARNVKVSLETMSTKDRVFDVAVEDIRVEESGMLAVIIRNKADKISRDIEIVISEKHKEEHTINSKTLEDKGFLEYKGTSTLRPFAIHGKTEIRVCIDTEEVLDEINEKNNCLVKELKGPEIEPKAPEISTDIEIIEPNGGEIYKSGDKVRVVFKTDTDIAKTANLYYITDKKDKILIEENIKTTQGGYTWTIPGIKPQMLRLLVVAYNEKAEVIREDVTDGKITIAETDPRITEEPNPQPENPEPQVFIGDPIEITKPSGGKTQNSGMPMLIEYSLDKERVKKIEIYLYEGSEMKALIGRDTDPQGSYIWNVPADSNYKAAQIVIIAENAVTGEKIIAATKTPFAIEELKSPQKPEENQIKITTPAVDTEYKTGEKMKIVFKADKDLVTEAAMMLFNAGIKVTDIDPELNLKETEKEWKIPEKIGEIQDGKIVIMAIDTKQNKKITAESSGRIIITKPDSIQDPEDETTEDEQEVTINYGSGSGGGGFGGGGGGIIINNAAKTPQKSTTSGFSKLIKMPCNSITDRDVNHPCKTVYYYSKYGTRHAFTNEKSFFTWYKGFGSVNIISKEAMANIPLAENVTYHPGKRMIKFSQDKVYAVQRGGILRAIESEATARALYGAGWNQEIDDVNDAFYIDYKIGVPIINPAEFSPTAALQSVLCINDNL